MKYEGVVYRPPSEARSLIVQVTIGCAHNTCTFCNMYKDKQFRVRKMEEIMADLQEAHDAYAAYVQKVFLADGDALIMKTEDLLTRQAWGLSMWERRQEMMKSLNTSTRESPQGK